MTRRSAEHGEKDEKALRYARRPLGGTDGLAFAAVEDRLRTLGLCGTALDVGCGPGRSTRFLKSVGFDVIGLDVDHDMLDEARNADPDGLYESYAAGESFPFEDASFDLALSTWAVLEIASFDGLGHLVEETARILRPGGRAFVVTNTPAFYSGRWVSCDIDFPENAAPLRSGQTVRARLVPEGVVVTDTFWEDADYRRAFAAASLSIVHAHLPLAASEPGWFDETTTAPYVVYELRRE